MQPLTCDIKTLAQSRPMDLGRCLSGISTISPYVHPKSRHSEFVLVAAYGQPLTATEREWSFPSTVDWIECRYMERWLPVGATDDVWKLRHAYFYLYQHLGPNVPPKEIFAFHWEPVGDDGSNAGAEHIRRPHLHVASSLESLTRSHLVVTLTVPPSSQTNVSYLNELLEEVMGMVGVEVLNRMPAHP